MNLYSRPREEMPVFTRRAKFISAQKFFNHTKAKTSHVNTQPEQMPWKKRRKKKDNRTRENGGKPTSLPGNKHLCLQADKHTHGTVFIHYEDGTPLHLHEGYYSGCYLLQDHFQRLLLFKNQAGKVKKHLNKRSFVRVGLTDLHNNYLHWCLWVCSSPLNQGSQCFCLWPEASFGSHRPQGNSQY